jgi:hypothetical protein
MGDRISLGADWRKICASGGIIVTVLGLEQPLVLRTHGRRFQFECVLKAHPTETTEQDNDLKASIGVMMSPHSITPGTFQPR